MIEEKCKADIQPVHLSLHLFVLREISWQCFNIFLTCRVIKWKLPLEQHLHCNSWISMKLSVNLRTSGWPWTFHLIWPLYKHYHWFHFEGRENKKNVKNQQAHGSRWRLWEWFHSIPPVNLLLTRCRWIVSHPGQQLPNDSSNILTMVYMLSLPWMVPSIRTVRATNHCKEKRNVVRSCSVTLNCYFCSVHGTELTIAPGNMNNSQLHVSWPKC